MEKFKIVKVNLQEGLFLDGENLVAVYSHHNKVIVFRDYTPEYMGMIPADEFTGYQVITHGTDSIGLNVYTHDGYKSLYEFKRIVNKKLNRVTAQ